MKIAIVQKEPPHLDLMGCMEVTRQSVKEAADAGAKLVVFGETWFCGYPAWLDYGLNVARWNDPDMKRLYARMIQHALIVGSDIFKDICSLASDHQVFLVFGANEYKPEKAKGTLYNSLFMIDPAGSLVNHHRKLMPTYTEKLLHTTGDGNGLKSVALENMKVGGLICWEHWMPLTRQAMHDSGETIHVALWPSVHEMHQIASRHYAFEGRCYVLAAGQLFHSDHFPVEIAHPDELQKNPTWVLNGGSCVIAPNGLFIVPPVFDLEAIIYADLDDQMILEESLTLDTSGHYQRKDIFDFQVKMTNR